MEKVRNPVPEVVSIVACGPSALKCGAARAPGHVIAVNDAYRHVRYDTALSMDGRWAQYRIADFRQRPPPRLWLRRSAWNHVPATEHWRDESKWLRIFDCDRKNDEFSMVEAQFNGPNSGYCALNLAWQMKPKRVYLFGFDHKGDHFHPESEWVLRGEGSRNGARKFASWSASCYVAREYFDNAGVHVINTNANSAVRAFDFGDCP